MKLHTFSYLSLGILMSLLISCDSQQPEEPYYNEMKALMAEYVPYIAHWLPYEVGDNIILTCDKETIALSVTSANTETVVPVRQTIFPFKDCDCQEFYFTSCWRTIKIEQENNPAILVGLEIRGSKTLPWDGVWTYLVQPAPDKMIYQDIILMDNNFAAIDPVFEDCIPLADTISFRASIDTFIDYVYIVKDKGIVQIIDTDKRTWNLSSDIKE